VQTLYLISYLFFILIIIKYGRGAPVSPSCPAWVLALKSSLEGLLLAEESMKKKYAEASILLFLFYFVNMVSFSSLLFNISYFLLCSSTNPVTHSSAASSTRALSFTRCAPAWVSHLCCDHSVNIQWAFSEHLVNSQGTSRENSGNIQGLFREHSGNIQWTFSE
jgi:hypothetical protein